MKLQFKRQKLQADAAKPVCDVFAGQPYLTPTHMMDSGFGEWVLPDTASFTGFGNARISTALNDDLILEQIQKIQRAIVDSKLGDRKEACPRRCRLFAALFASEHTSVIPSSGVLRGVRYCVYAFEREGLSCSMLLRCRGVCVAMAGAVLRNPNDLVRWPAFGV